MDKVPGTFTPKTEQAIHHEVGAKVQLPNGYWLEKRSDNTWGLGREIDLALDITSSTPCGPGGSIDSDINDFARAMNTGNGRFAEILNGMCPTGGAVVFMPSRLHEEDEQGRVLSGSAASEYVRQQMATPLYSPVKIICDGCRVASPFEHRCHGARTKVDGLVGDYQCVCTECR